MDSFKVTLENFQSIRSGEVEFIPGINVVVGNNNEGKSAIFRAIDFAMFNKTGNGFITVGHSGTKISITYKGHTYVWEKGMRGSASAVFDGDIMEKLGSNPVTEVLDKLGFSFVDLSKTKIKLNFHKEDDPPFLSDVSSADLYSFIGISSESDRLDLVLKDLKKDIQELKSDVNRITGGIDVLTRQKNQYREIVEKLKPMEDISKQVMVSRKKYDDVKDLCMLTYDLEEMTRKLDLQKNQISDKKRKCVSFDKVNKGIVERFQRMKCLCRFMKEINEIEKLVSIKVSETDSLRGVLKGLDQAVEYYDIAKGKQEVFEGVSGVVSYIHEIEEMIFRSDQEAENLQDQFGRYEEACKVLEKGLGADTSLKKVCEMVKDFKKIKIIGEDIKSREERLEEDEARLKEFKVCPLCNSTLEG